MFATTGLAVVVAMAWFVASAFGVLAGSPSNFESNDGNMTVETSHDWANVNFFHVVDAASSQSDDSFVSGQKQDTTCPDTYGHGNPPKDDFTDVASFSETNGDSSSAQYRHTFLYGATIRYAANGNASENVELKQGTNGSCANGLLARTSGDKLVAIDYLNGGTNVQFNVLTWIVDSSGFDPTPGSDPTDDIAGTCNVSNDTPPCWSSTVQKLSANAAEGKASQALIKKADDPIGNSADSADSTKSSVEKGKDLAAGQFAEFGVDLTAAGIVPAGQCKAFPQTIWESRSSGSSFVSTTKDISIENHTISNCGEIKIIKQTKPRGADQVFSFSSGTSNTNQLPTNSGAGGVNCFGQTTAGVNSDGTFCLNDHNNAGTTLGSTAANQNDTDNTVSEDNVPPGTYSVSESATDPSGFAFDSVTCTGGSTSTSGRTATITLAVNDVVTCVYQNNQQFGYLKILKTSSKAAGTPLSGAKFSIKDPSGTALSGSDYTTDANGSVCVDTLPLGDYKVQETAAPSGYAIDDTTERTVTVSASSAKCNDATPPAVSTGATFTDTPLTDLMVKATSEVTGGTKSAITCVDAGNHAIGNSPQPNGAVLGTTSTYGDPVTLNADPTHGAALKPGTYTCTVTIDP